MNDAEAMGFLKNVVASSRIPGNWAATKLLRDICAKAVEEAPTLALIAIGECLCNLPPECLIASQDWMSKKGIS